jgi:hypothetical protein
MTRSGTPGITRRFKSGHGFFCLHQECQLMRKITFSGSEYFLNSPYGQGFLSSGENGMGPKDIRPDEC